MSYVKIKTVMIGFRGDRFKLFARNNCTVLSYDDVEGICCSSFISDFITISLRNSYILMRTLLDSLQKKLLL